MDIINYTNNSNERKLTISHLKVTVSYTVFLIELLMCSVGGVKGGVLDMCE